MGFSAKFVNTVSLLAALLTFIEASSIKKPEECGVNDLRCCVAPFSKTVSPSGLLLTTQNIAAGCTLQDEILDCTETYRMQCFSDDKDLSKTINDTNEFIEHICPPSSDFMKKLAANEECFLNTSQEFQTCFNRTILPNTDEYEKSWKRDCCEYKEVRNCAVQTVETACGPSAAQFLQEEIVAIQGLGLEIVCKDLFGECGNSADVPSHSATVFAVLFSVLFLTLL